MGSRAFAIPLQRSSPRTPPSFSFRRRVSTMNLAHLGVSTRGGVNQPLACPGVRAHRDPDALGGHICVLPMSIEIGGAVLCAWDIWGVALILAPWRRIPHPVIPQQACAQRDRRRIEDVRWHLGVDNPQGACIGRCESAISIYNPLCSITTIMAHAHFHGEGKWSSSAIPPSHRITHVPRALQQ